MDWFLYDNGLRHEALALPISYEALALPAPYIVLLE